ncbi:Helicase associated domain protein [Streptomyces sp. NBC_01092]|uniref:DEAD/DEAH box helicase n=1 Tax=Streptomyces sp. NBC_01092 TaxID=2903748 RepID=UPI0038673DE1|nr:Helicase associated domain protein [Streptomyces sp. NBC_01092]
MVDAVPLRPYQRQIIDSVVAGLRSGGPGQIHMACGSGKTLVGQRAAEELLPHGGTVAVLVPSLALVAQTLNAWRRRSALPLDVLAVCSDDSVADSLVHVADLPVPVSTHPGQITQWLSGPSEDGCLRLVLCTYVSGPRLAEAVRATRPLDLVIADEAHHLAGRADSPTRQIRNPQVLPASRRLYMTATPKVDIRTDVVDAPGMDDTGLFGPVLDAYPFARGIAEGYLEDYRIAVIGVPDREARELLANQDTEYLEEAGAPSLQTVVSQAALARARQQFGVRRMLTFHPRIEAAAEFTRTLNRSVQRIAPGEDQHLAAAYVHGGMDHATRDSIVRKLEQPGDGWVVVSNARCLGEGVDLPSVDAILFAHPKRSAVDISQAVGRALRRDPDAPGPATIIVPLIVPDDDREIGDLDPGDFKTLWQVVRALRAHDETLGAALDATRQTASSHNLSLPSKITMMLPPGLNADALLAQMRLLLVRQTTSPWWDGYQGAVRYREEHGHLHVPANYQSANGHRLGAWIARRRWERRRGFLSAERVGQLTELGIDWNPGSTAFAARLDALTQFHNQHRHVRVSPKQDRNLHQWLVKLRGMRDKLDANRIVALDALGMVWYTDLPDERWTAGIAAAGRYYAARGNLAAPRSYRDGEFRLGDWLNTQRYQYRKGELLPQRVVQLEALGMVWEPEETRWRQMLTVAEVFYNTHGHLRVPRSYTTPDGARLGSWLLHQRRLRSGMKKGGISEERIAALDVLGMVW